MKLSSFKVVILQACHPEAGVLCPPKDLCNSGRQHRRFASNAVWSAIFLSERVTNAISIPHALSAPFHLGCAGVSNRPFPHLEAENSLDAALADALLTWFEENAHWQIKKLNGYTGYTDISLFPGDLPSELDLLLLPETFSHLRSCMGKFFAIDPEGYVRVTAHRLLAGASLRPHTDLAPLRFTHRLIVQLNRGWTRANGGLLCLADNERFCNEQKSPKLITPTHNNAFAFEVSQRSFHSVTQVVKGERYTLSYTFYPDSPEF